VHEDEDVCKSSAPVLAAILLFFLAARNGSKSCSLAIIAVADFVNSWQLFSWFFN